MADDDAIEIDEFAMFQARSMGVETEYLEMAKAGRHQGRSSHSRRGEENSPGTSSGRRRGQRSSGGRQRGSRQSRGDEETGTPYDSPNSPRQSDATGEWNCRSGVPGDDENTTQDVEETEGQPENGPNECQQPLQRSHSYRSKRSGGQQSWAEGDPPEKPTEASEQQDDPITCDLKRTLTMPAKRHRDRPTAKSSVDGTGRDSIRSWGRPRDLAPQQEGNDNLEEEELKTADFRSSSPGLRGNASRTRRSDNGLESPGSDGRAGRGRLDEFQRAGKGGVAWKDTVISTHNSSSLHNQGVIIGKKSSLLRHDSSGSCQLRNPPQTPPDSNRHRRTSNETNARTSTGDAATAGKTGTLDRLSSGTQNDVGGSRSENGRGGGGESGIRDPGGVSVRVAASRVERPPPGHEATVYKVLVLGSQGVGKSMVTQQLLTAGNEEDDGQ